MAMAVSYVHGSLWNAKIEQDIHHNINKFSDNATKVWNLINSTSFRFQVSWPRRMLFENILISANNAGSRVSKNSFLIWNLGLSYRALKKESLEFKVFFYDLLKQSSGIVNQSSINSLTVGRVNMLQQYAMFSVLYYPRKFGK